MSKKTTLELLEDNLNKHMAICDFKRKVKSFKAENEKLRKAGDELYLICQLFAKHKSEPARKAWYNAKKEGRDAK